MYRHVTLLIVKHKNYGTPKGIMNDMWSANAPQFALFNWKIVTHVTNNTNQIADPIAEKITSKRHTVSFYAS